MQTIGQLGSGNSPTIAQRGRGGGGGGGGNNRKRKKRNNRNGGGGGGMDGPNTSKGPSSPGDVIDTTDEDFLNTLAQNDPQGFYAGQLRNSGEITGSGPGLYENWLQNQHFNDLYSAYTGARANDPGNPFIHPGGGAGADPGYGRPIIGGGPGGAGVSPPALMAGGGAPGGPGQPGPGGQGQPELGFRQFLAQNPNDLAQARNQYLSLTNSQRGGFSNPFGAGLGHYSWYG